MELREYQSEAISAVSTMFRNGKKKALVVLPTGCGKTVVFAKMTELTYYRKDTNRVLILAHRGELLEQAQDKLFKVSGISSSIEKATNYGYGDRVVIGSMQTLCRDDRLHQYPRDYFNMIVIDECHHVLTPSYKKILDYFCDSYVVGVTATPDRGDQKGLIYNEETKEGFFDGLAYEYSIYDAVRNGYLSKLKALKVPLKIDLNQVHMKQGDYDQSEVYEILKDNLYKIAEAMQQYCSDRKTVVFMPLVNSSQMFADILNSYGFNAIEVNGNTKDRSQRLQDFYEGKYNVLCNAMLLTEGWDCPDVDCVIVLRPTKVRALYQQMVGRGMRLAEGKNDCLLLDFLWLSDKHDLCSPASILAKNNDISKKINEKLDNNVQCFDLLDINEEAEQEYIKEKRDNNNSLNKELDQYRYKSLEEVDPIFGAITDDSLRYWEPNSLDDMLPATEKQINALLKFGIDTENVHHKGFASQILNKLFKRAELHLATARQVKYLKDRHFKYAEYLPFDEANKLISHIIKNKGGIPSGINPQTYGEF